MDMAKKVIVEGKNLSKAFGENMVLKDVSIQCIAGEGLAIAGENGAGKSTLMNIISGGLMPTSGNVFVDGGECHFTSSGQARARGIAFVHQELSLMEEMTVGENIMLGQEPKSHGMIRQKELHRMAKEVLEDVGYQIDVYALVKNLTPAER